MSEDPRGLAECIQKVDQGRSLKLLICGFCFPQKKKKIYTVTMAWTNWKRLFRHVTTIQTVLIVCAVFHMLGIPMLADRADYIKVVVTA